MELLSAQSSASSDGGKCSLQTRRRSSTLPPILRARIDLYNSRSHAIDARSPPDVGRLRVVVRQLVPVLRHRQHPYGAERGNHRDIHDAPHGPIPRLTHSGRIASPFQEFREGSGNPAGVAFRQRKRAFVLFDEPILLAKGIVMQASRSPVRDTAITSCAI